MVRLAGADALGGDCHTVNTAGPNARRHGLMAARPPEGEVDACVTVAHEEDTVVAMSWSSWRVRYHVTSGLERNCDFTK